MAGHGLRRFRRTAVGRPCGREIRLLAKVPFIRGHAQ